MYPCLSSYGHIMSLKPNCKQLAEVLGRELLKRKYTLSTAESCTGGMVGAAITAVPGSSAWFRGGIIAYENTIKIVHCSVPEKLIRKNGAVSEETVTAMAKGVAQKLQTDCAIAVSGIAGPDGGSEEKPVGLVFVGVYSRGNSEVFRNVFSGDREAVRELAVEEGLRRCTELLVKT